jgi:hypothetical protein
MKDFEFFCRCSSLGTLMTDPRSIDPALLDDVTRPIAAKKAKTPEDHAILAPLFDMTLSAGAKTMIESLVRAQVLGYEEKFSSKYTTKGNNVENDSIELYNERFQTYHIKHKGRRFNDYIQGEPDIITPVKIIDIKSSWSLKTFPMTAEEAHDPGYEWQVRGYMWLFDREEAEVAFCLVDTPEDLIGFEDRHLHKFERRHLIEHEDGIKREQLAIELRITTVQYRRDRALEERVMRRVTAARAYAGQYMKTIYDQHPDK